MGTLVEQSSPVKASRTSRRSSNDKPNYNINSKFEDLEEEIQLLNETTDSKVSRSKKDSSKNKPGARNKPGPASKKSKTKPTATVIDLDDESDDDDIIIDDDVNSLSGMADAPCFDEPADYDDYPQETTFNEFVQNDTDNESWKDWIFSRIWESHTKSSKLVEVVSIEEMSIEQNASESVEKRLEEAKSLIIRVDPVDPPDFQAWKEWTLSKIWDYHQPKPTIERIAEPEAPTIIPSQISIGEPQLQTRYSTRKRNKSTDIASTNIDIIDKKLQDEVQSFEKEITFSHFDDSDGNTNNNTEDECNIFLPLTSYGKSYPDGISCPLTDVKIVEMNAKLAYQEASLSLKDTHDELFSTEKILALNSSELMEWKDVIFSLIWSHTNFAKTFNTELKETPKNSQEVVSAIQLKEKEGANQETHNNNTAGSNYDNSGETEKEKPETNKNASQKSITIDQLALKNNVEEIAEEIIFDYDNLSQSKERVFDLIWSRFMGNKSLGMEQPTKNYKHSLRAFDCDDEPLSKRSRRSSINSNPGKVENNKTKESKTTSEKSRRISDSLNNNVSPIKHKNDDKSITIDKPSLRKAGPASKMNALSSKTEVLTKRPGPASRRSSRSRA